MTGQSLKTFFKREAVRWALIGLSITLVFSIPCLNYVMKFASERQVSSLAQSAAMAFRPLITAGARDAQLQISHTLGLKDGESVVVRDPEFKMIYSMDGNGDVATCATPLKYCWSSGFRYVEYLVPIYFDEHGAMLFGYLDLKVAPVVDTKLLALLLSLILFGFAVQSLGLTSALSKSANEVTKRLTSWATHLKNTPSSHPEQLPPAPFIELVTMQEAVNGLHGEIKKFGEIVADEARVEAELGIVKELGHELKTPLSQLRKLFAIYENIVKQTGNVDDTTSARITRTLNRMRGAIQQVRAMRSHSELDKNEVCDLPIEAKLLIDDLWLDSDIAQKQVNVRLLTDSENLPAKVQKVAFQRILENLLRNSVHAVPVGSEITVSTIQKNGRPTLVVKDQGPGIPSELKANLFKTERSTKPGRGSGMGLRIVNDLCNEFGANIGYTSEPSKFTIFEISFLPNENRGAV